MIVYLLWGVIFGMMFHLAMLTSKQEVVFTEILIVILAWPVMLLFIAIGVINELMK
jgi:hypothetical protein